MNLLTHTHVCIHSILSLSLSTVCSIYQTFYLLHEEGFFVGASSGFNVAAAVQVSHITVVKKSCTFFQSSVFISLISVIRLLKTWDLAILLSLVCVIVDR